MKDYRRTQEAARKRMAAPKAARLAGEKAAKENDFPCHESYLSGHRRGT